MSATLIRTRRPWWERLWIDLQVAYLQWCEDCVREERESYLEAAKYGGPPLGPAYLANSYAQEESLRVRVALLLAR